MEVLSELRWAFATLICRPNVRSAPDAHRLHTTTSVLCLGPQACAHNGLNTRIYRHHRYQGLGMLKPRP
jgi:hypothetical protein